MPSLESDLPLRGLPPLSVKSWDAPVISRLSVNVLLFWQIH